MRKVFIFAVLVMTLNSCVSQTTNFKDGDIIFQTSRSSQSGVIQMLTKSNLSHCGIIFYKNGKPYVFEAVNPVKVTPLNAWINRGAGARYKVVRAKQNISADEKKRMYEYAKSQLGKPYDVKFQWSDSKMYCSELVYKTYIAGDIRLGDCKLFRDYNISNPIVKKLIAQRFHNDFSNDEPVISPVDLCYSDKVKLIYSNY